MGQRTRDFALLAPASLAVAALFGGALAGIVHTSLVPLGEGATFEAWRELLRDPAFGDAVAFTAQITVLSTVLAAVLALLLARVLRGRENRLVALLALPVPVPHLLVATLAVVWLAPGGLAERILGGLPVDLVRDRAGLGIILVYVYKEAPFLVLLLLAASGGGLREREEAAAVLGASGWQRLRWVTWPAIRAPLVVGSIIVAAYVAGSFEVPLAVGPNHPPTVATYAFEAAQGDLIAGQGQGAAALLLAAAFSVVLALAVMRLARDVEGA
ncbi:MAG: ABC transporter permease subunit [Actinobacteria bacterium]|nr:ABC transporter permease subunit [Actinomycetota bacterium]